MAEEFWKKYVDADIIERNNIVEGLVKSSLIQDIQNMKGEHYDRCMIMLLNGYFEDLTSFLSSRKSFVTDCKFIHADWCHKSERCVDGQEKCSSYHHQDECPDYEKNVIVKHD